METISSEGVVKTNTFNGLNLPSIVLADSDRKAHRVWKAFGYRDFLKRL